MTEAPLTLTQRSSLLMAPHSPSREFMSWVYQLNGKLDVGALTQAIDDVVERHPMLRTRFVDGAQVVVPHHAGVTAVIKLDDRPKLEALTAAVKALEVDYQDLDPLDDSRLQATLYLVAPKTNVLSIVVAEALIDGDSATLIAGELSRAYARHAGKPPPEMPEPSDADFLEFVTEHPVASATEAKAEAHWRTLVDVPQAAGSWPTVTGDRTLSHFFQVSAEEWAGVVERQPALATLPFVVLLSWVELALHRVAGAEHFWVTSAVSSRRLPVTREMIGNFVGPVRLEATVNEGDGLEEIFPRVMGEWRKILSNGVLPYPVAEARSQAPAAYEPSPPLVSVFYFPERLGPTLAGVRQRRFRVHTGNRDILRVNCTPADAGARNFFFLSASAPRPLLDALAAEVRSLMGLA